VRERLVGLCRESPFTALASGATFAVTDDQLNPGQTYASYQLFIIFKRLEGEVFFELFCSSKRMN
jgi:hypothetical protein